MAGALASALSSGLSAAVVKVMGGCYLKEGRGDLYAGWSIGCHGRCEECFAWTFIAFSGYVRHEVCDLFLRTDLLSL